MKKVYIYFLAGIDFVVWNIFMSWQYSLVSYKSALESNKQFYGIK